jgi:hypothetical protein
LERLAFAASLSAQQSQQSSDAFVLPFCPSHNSKVVLFLECQDVLWLLQLASTQGILSTRAVES